MNIRLYAYLVRFVALFFLLPALVVSWIVPWFYNILLPYSISWTKNISARHDYHQQILHTTGLIKFTGFLVVTISHILLFLLMFYVIKLLNCYLRNELFSSRTFSLYTKITRLFFLWAAYNVIEYTLLGLVTTITMPVGQRVISIALSSNDVIYMVIAGFLAIITGLMEQAYQIKHEQDLTI